MDGEAAEQSVVDVAASVGGDLDVASTETLVLTLNLAPPHPPACFPAGAGAAGHGPDSATRDRRPANHSRTVGERFLGHRISIINVIASITSVIASITSVIASITSRPPNPYQASSSQLAAFPFASRANVQSAPLFYSTTDEFREANDEEEHEREIADFYALQKSRRHLGSSDLKESSEAGDESGSSGGDHLAGAHPSRPEFSRINPGAGIRSSWRGGMKSSRALAPNVDAVAESSEDDSGAPMVDIGLDSTYRSEADDDPPDDILDDILDDPPSVQLLRRPPQAEPSSGSAVDELHTGHDRLLGQSDALPWADEMADEAPEVVPPPQQVVVPHHDAFWGHLYLLCLAAMATTWFLILLHTSAESKPKGDTAYNTLHSSFRLLLTYTIISVFVSLLWLATLRAYLRALVYGVLVAVPVILYSFSLYPLISSFQGRWHGRKLQDYAMRWGSLLPAAMATLWILAIMRGRHSMQRAINILEFAARVLGENPALVLVGFGTLGSIIAFTWAWLAMFTRVFLGGHPDGRSTSVRFIIDTSTWWLGAYFVLVYLWTISVIFGMQRTVTSATVSQWYFHRRALPKLTSQTIVKAALRHSSSTLFGTIALYTGLSLLVRLPLLILPRRLTMLLGLAMYSLIPTPIALLINPLTLTYAAIHSRPLKVSAAGLSTMHFLLPNDVTTTLHPNTFHNGRNGDGWSSDARPLFPYRLAKLLLHATRFMVSLAMGFGGWVTTARSMRVAEAGLRGSLYAYIVGLIAAAIGWSILGAMEGILGCIVDALVICWASEVGHNGTGEARYCREAGELFSENAVTDGFRDSLAALQPYNLSTEPGGLGIAAQKGLRDRRSVIGFWCGARERVSEHVLPDFLATELRLRYDGNCFVHFDGRVKKASTNSFLCPPLYYYFCCSLPSLLRFCTLLLHIVPAASRACLRRFNLYSWVCLLISSHRFPSLSMAADNALATGASKEGRDSQVRLRHPANDTATAYGKNPTAAAVDAEDIKKLHKAKPSLLQTVDEWEFVIAPLVFTLFAAFTRLWKIGLSPIVTWDEAHFGKFGSHYLKREFYFDVHPPLGKMLVGLSGYLGGYNGSFEFKSGETYPAEVNYTFMRIFNASFGILTVPLAYYTARELKLKRSAVWLITLMVLCENSYATISRFILLDSMLLCFTFTTVLCWARFHSLQKDAWSAEWLAWLFLTGISIGCVCSVKWVGAFATAMVGLYTIEDLWAKFGDLKLPKTELGAHFLVRVFGLILVPLAVYMFSFWIHFLVLENSGPGDAQMSSLFQANLRGTEVGKDSPLEIAYGSKATLKNMGYGGGLLHSHVQTYPEGSGQQQVTCYHHKDSNNDWFFYPNRSEPEYDPAAPLAFVSDRSVIRLIHAQTGRNLHSHQVSAPVTKGDYEVSCYGNVTIGDDKDHWQIEIVGDAASSDRSRVRTLTTAFRLRHPILGCYLRAGNVNLPQWGFKQIETTCVKTNNPRDVYTHWNVESHVNERLPPGDAKSYRSPFLRDFIHLNVAMMTSNNALVPDPDKQDDLASHFWQWPILDVGLRMCSWEDHITKYFLLGNPIVYWASTASLGLTLAIVAWYLVRWQRGYTELNRADINHIKQAGIYPVIGWVLHYLPFIIMARVTYVHHYYPALYFAILTTGFVADWFTRPLGVKSRWAVYGVLYSIVIGLFVLFSPIVFGMQGSNRDYAYLRWFRRWRISDAEGPFGSGW
ncbi:hypothetical protein DV736_g5470, partial [Chaetothyriales sp. CBS 134916]